jgi:hypothetical protein
VPRRDYSTRLDFFDFPAKSNVVVHSGFGQSHTEVLVAGVQMALPHLSSLGHQSDRAALGHIHSDLRYILSRDPRFHDALIIILIERFVLCGSQ